MTRFDKVYSKVSPIVKSYRSDIELDRELITDPENKKVCFIIQAGECGTHVIALTPAEHSCWPEHGEKVRYMFGHAYRRDIL